MGSSLVGRRRAVALLGGGLAATLLAACGGGGSTPPENALSSSGVDLRTLSGTIRIDGSSTVFPITEAMAEEFQLATGGRVRVTVGISGTGGGFKKFCAGETDMQDASRPISVAEAQSCHERSIDWIELPVAFDGISIVVSPRNEFLQEIKVSELKKIWQPTAQGTITRWNQIRPEWPDAPMRLYGAGADSGTFDYFTDAINGKEKASRGDYTSSEDDNVLVQGVATDANALAYFGYAYYLENKDRLRLVPVDGENGRGPVLPTPETIQNGSYQPLSRPIFVYVRADSLDRPEMSEFVRFYLEPQNASVLVEQVGFIPFPTDIYQQALERMERRRTGSVFGGGSVQGITIAELFERTPRPLAGPGAPARKE